MAPADPYTSPENDPPTPPHTSHTLHIPRPWQVLMKRHAKTAYAFAAALAVKGEPIGDAELSHYFAAPGESR